jgi:hypothetical protein
MTTIYPSFYAAVHAAWNQLHDRLLRDPHTATPIWYALHNLPSCAGAVSPYEPDEHPFCFELAGALRVELHAAGVWLSNDGTPTLVYDDGNATPVRPGDVIVGFIDPWPEFRQQVADSERYELPDDVIDSPIAPKPPLLDRVRGFLGLKVFG